MARTPTPEELDAGRNHPACADTRLCPLCVRMRTSPLVSALQVAVPLNVWHVNRLKGETRDIQLARWREHALPAISERGDLILYPNKNGKRGDNATPFNDLAKGMAALSFHRGGFEAFGLHWCAYHSPGGVIPTRRPVCPACADLEAAEGWRECDCCRLAAPPWPWTPQPAEATG